MRLKIDYKPDFEKKKMKYRKFLVGSIHWKLIFEALQYFQLTIPQTRLEPEPQFELLIKVVS